MPIGIFDSGLGGLTVLSRLQQALPDQSFLYLGDNANAPYGTRPSAEILDLTMAGCAALFDRGCGLVILACNTASAVALRQMQEFWVPADRRVLGVLVPVIEALAARPWALRSPPSPIAATEIVFFGTPATVASGAFSRELALRASSPRVFEVPCPGLVQALEAGDRPRAEDLAHGFARSAADVVPSPDAVVLGCTHYPLVREAFAAALPARVRILSQPDIVADSLCDYLRRHPGFKAGGSSTYLTTGGAGDVRAAGRALTGRDLPFKQV